MRSLTAHETRVSSQAKCQKGWLDQFSRDGLHSFRSARLPGVRELLEDAEAEVRVASGFSGFSVDALARANRLYVAYARAAHFVGRFAQDFSVVQDENQLLLRGTIFCIWSKVVDNYLDEHGGSAARVIKRLKETTLQPPADTALDALTDCVRRIVLPRHLEFVRLAQELGSLLEEEKRCNNLNALITCREQVGAITARLMLLALGDSIKPSARFLSCMNDLGAIANVCDSALDLAHDARTGQLGFEPRCFDQLSLFGIASRGVMRLLATYPELQPEIFGVLLRVPKWYWFTRDTGRRAADVRLS